MYCKSCGDEIIKRCSKCQLKDNFFERFRNLIFTGRIGRIRYLICIILFAFVLAIPFGIVKEFFGYEYAMHLMSLFFIPITAKRLRDINFSGYYSILLYLLPFINELALLSSVIGLYLLFKKGDGHINRYGEIPQITKNMNRLMIAILIIFLIPLLLFLISLLSL